MRNVSKEGPRHSEVGESGGSYLRIHERMVVTSQKTNWGGGKVGFPTEYLGTQLKFNIASGLPFQPAADSS